MPSGKTHRSEQRHARLIASFIGGIADDVLRDLYVRGKYRDVIERVTGIPARIWNQ